MHQMHCTGALYITHSGMRCSCHLAIIQPVQNALTPSGNHRLCPKRAQHAPSRQCSHHVAESKSECMRGPALRYPDQRTIVSRDSTYSSFASQSLFILPTLDFCLAVICACSLDFCHHPCCDDFAPVILSLLSLCTLPYVIKAKTKLLSLEDECLFLIMVQHCPLLLHAIKASR